MPAPRSDLRNVAIVVVLCGVFSYLRWLKLDSLVWGDPARWLFEAQRLAAGELPYRDFSWQYPPFAILLLGWTMRWFGATFTVAQIVIDAVSGALVLLGYFLIRPLLPRFLHLPAILFLLCVCGTSLMFFNLFSFLTYVPALQTGAAGLLLLLIGVLSYLRSGKLKAGTWLSIAGGAFVAAYSKPESLLATYSTLAMVALVDRRRWFADRPAASWIRHYAKLLAVCVLPAIAAYIWFGAAAGFANMKAGVTGYGLASSSCPWWPTGIGVFGALASLGEAAGIAALLSLTRREQFLTRFGRIYYRGLAAGVAGMVLYIVYVFYNNWSLLTGSRPMVEKILHSASNTVWTSAILLPVMWTSVALWLFLAGRFAFGRAVNVDALETIVLLTGPVAMSLRGWFGTTQGALTSVPAICYPFFLLLAPYLMWRFLALAGPGLDGGIRTRAGATVSAGLLVYAALRLVAGYPNLLSDAPYRSLSTLAGDIRLSEYTADSEIYRFVLENTSDSDFVLDIPYGGGINVAARRRSPLFDTQLRGLDLPAEVVARDLEGIRRRPPKVIIAQNEPNFGAVQGAPGLRCEFPRLVWAPLTSAAVPDRDFPALKYIEPNYRVVKSIGSKVLLMAREPGPVTSK